MRGLMKLICLIRLFWHAFASSAAEENDQERGLKLAELFLAPFILPFRVNHIQIDGSQPPVTTRRANRLRARPQTPGPLPSNRLAPLNHKTLVVQETKALEISEKEPFLTTLKPVKAPKLRQSSCGSNDHDSEEAIPIDDFHEEIEAAVAQSNADACSHLSKRPEMKLLKADELFELLQSALSRYENSRNSKRLFLELFEEIVDGIVPESHPHHFKKFIISVATKQQVPNTLFALVCKHVKLLSKSSLNELVRKIEMKTIWEQIERVGFSDLKRFNFMIIEIANNLESSEEIVKLDYVKNILAMTKGDALGRGVSKTLAKVQFTYMTTYLLSALKAIGPQDDYNQMKGALDNLIKIGRNDLKMDTEDLLDLMEPVWRAFLPQITPEQKEPFGRFMAILHEIILEQVDLPFIPSTMAGCEDLFLYVANNLINLVQARLNYYRSNRVTKGQLLTLLIAAETASRTSPDLILVILASIQVKRRSLSEQDFDSLQISSRTALKILYTLPKRYEGDICTPSAVLKHSETVAWRLPEDLFLPNDPGSRAFLLTDTLLNIPRLFLYRVFGLPLMNFAEVGPGMNEIPEMKELIDVANFFIERWCAYKESYPKVKVVV